MVSIYLRSQERAWYFLRADLGAANISLTESELLSLGQKHRDLRNTCASSSRSSAEAPHTF